MHAGYTMLVVETQESVHTEKQALSRVLHQRSRGDLGAPRG